MQAASVRTTITIDDELFRKAVEVADPGMDRGEIVREAMRVFVRVQSGKRLAALGGAAPRMKDIPRRRAAGRAAR
jgi:Arc/MetJ family transcription regulator